jgi:hypothetical protein
VPKPVKPPSQLAKKTADPALVELTLHTRVRELRKLLTSNEPLETVVAFVQKEMGLFRDLAAETVMRHLRTYRATIPAWEFKDAPELWTSSRVEKAVKDGLVKKLDVIRMTEGLVLLQQSRIDRAAMLEELDPEGGLDPLLGKEIERQRGNLQTLAVLYGDVKLMESLREPDPQVVEAEVVNTLPAGASAAMASPESRQKVLSILTQLKGIGLTRKTPQEAP